MRLALILSFLLPAGAALAQVTTNDSALGALKPAAPATPAPSRPVTRAPTHPRRTAPAQTLTHTKLPAVPAAPPPNPVIAPPPPNLPAHRPEPPPPVPVKADAKGTVSTEGPRTSITFGPDSADLNEATHQAILAVAAKAKADPALQITINAWAPDTPDDPSHSRRVSLDRALAARAVLIHAGIVSDRITAIANGAAGAGDSPDRLDILVALPRPTPQGKPLPPPAASH